MNCSIIVTVRDRFSTTFRCLDTLFKNTPEPFQLIAVLGGMPQEFREKVMKQYAGKGEFIFVERFLNPGESRNIGLRAAKTPLAVLMDNDVYVRPGWLEPLIRCQKETDAAMVVPLILEAPDRIHTAGNDLLITLKGGVAYACKELRFGLLAYYKGSNLKRRPTDYGELHCELVEVKTALEVNAFDDRLREAGEVDSGLAWAKAGCVMWFEPASVVHYDLPGPITRVEDIRPFMFKWDTQAIVDSYAYFKKKWDLDISEGGAWHAFLVVLNRKLGLLPRLWPSRFTLGLDGFYRRLRGFPGWAWEGISRSLYGYNKWGGD